MRRILTTTVASTLLALALPAAALAHHHGARHEFAYHARSHHRHHHRTVLFAPASTSTSTTPTTPTTPESETAGTVASFEGGVLTITLADGSTVSGKVTEDTWVSCGCPGHDGWNGGGEGWQGGDSNDQGDDNGPGGFDHHGDDESGPSSSSCGISALVPGAKVKEAELNLSGAGAVWEKVILASS